MSNLLRSEWIKLRTLRLNFVLPIIGAAFVIVIIALVGIFAPDPELSDSSDVADIVGISAILAGLLVSVIGVLSISSEFAHNTIRPTLVATPSRPKVIAAKAMLLVVVAAVYGLTVSVVAYLVGFGLLSARGAEMTLFDSDGTWNVILIGLPVLFVLLTLFGLGLGLLVRSSPAAVTLVILWPILIETIVGTTMAVAGVDDPGKFLPYQSASVLVSTSPDDFAHGRVAGGLFFAIVVVAIIGIATVVNNRRDV